MVDTGDPELAAVSDVEPGHRPGIPRPGDHHLVGTEGQPAREELVVLVDRVAEAAHVIRDRMLGERREPRPGPRSPAGPEAIPARAPRNIVWLSPWIWLTPICGVPDGADGAEACGGGRGSSGPSGGGLRLPATAAPRPAPAAIRTIASCGRGQGQATRRRRSWPDQPLGPARWVRACPSGRRRPAQRRLGAERGLDRRAPRHRSATAWGPGGTRRSAPARTRAATRNPAPSRPCADGRGQVGQHGGRGRPPARVAIQAGDHEPARSARQASVRSGGSVASCTSTSMTVSPW